MSERWKLLRVVVEAKVPPSNRSTEKDLVYHVEEAIREYGNGYGDSDGGVFTMPRAPHDDHYVARPRVKAWTPVFRYAVNHLPERIRRHIYMSY